MSRPILYLFIGYPGAGKTTVATIIAEVTGATHLWADAERHKLFPKPSHSLAESNQLYKQLNKAAEYLLKQGRSVVFDTNFNFYADRQMLRQAAAQQGADTIIIWVTTPPEVAKRRSVFNHQSRNGYPMNMSEERFDAIAAKLQPPRENEKIIKISGPKLDKPTVLALIKG